MITDKFLKFNLFFKFSYVKILLSIISISSFKPLTKVIRGNQEILSKNEYFYFTNLGLFLTITCVVIGLIKSFFAQNNILKKFYSFLIPISIVLEICVTIVFWLIFFIDPKLVKEDYCNLDGKIDLYSYFSEFPKHLFPLIILILEQSGIVFKRDLNHRIFFIVFSICYCSFSEFLIRKHKNYLYPFFKKMNFLGRLTIFSIISICCILFYEILMHFKAEKLRKSNLKLKKKILKNLKKNNDLFNG